MTGNVKEIMGRECSSFSGGEDAVILYWQLPGVVHNVLHYLVQNLFKESCPDPDVFDGLGGEGLRGAAGGGGALTPQRFVAYALGSPAQQHHTVNAKRSLPQARDVSL